MAKAAAQQGRRAHLPEQPVQGFSAHVRIARQKSVKLFGQIKQDGTRLKHPSRRGSAVVHQGRNLGIRVGRDETAAELVPLVNADQPGVVLGAAVAQRQQFLQQYRHLDAIGRSQRIQLQRMAANRQRLLVGGARHRAVDVSKTPTVGFLPLPDGRGGVGGRIGHVGQK